MKAMCLEQVGKPLVLREVERPTPQPGEVLLKVLTCGVCRTDLHIVDGDLPVPKLPLIPGHQIVGKIVELGEGVNHFQIGERVGVPWLGGTCHVCPYCMHERENLCDHPVFTGYTRNGGFAEYCTANAEYLLSLPSRYDDLHVAPLLCAGLIGFRAFRLAGDAHTLGFYGFGSSAHLLIQVASSLGKEVYVFTRPGDEKTQSFARSLGASWAGGSDQLSPVPFDAALIFAPVGALMPQALRSTKKGGRVISAGIHMSDIPSFPYSLLWEERSLSSVANLTRKDGHDFMDLAEKILLKVSVTEFTLEQANAALAAIRSGSAEGSCILNIAKSA
jgi:alcohol dehydrogenase, propanol-preferring